MGLNRIHVKLFVRDPAAVALDAFVPVFHRWIRDRVLDDTLIDVHDYSHVHQGAGILLVAFEANYSMDETAGDLGLLYGRKQPVEGDDAARLREALRAALFACSQLEGADELEGKLRFETDRIRVTINDRLGAPNTTEAFDTLRPTLDAVFGDLANGSGYTITRDDDPRQRLGADVRFEASPELDALLGRLSA